MKTTSTGSSSITHTGARQAPGPRTLPIGGVIPSLLRDPLKLYADLARFGDVVHYRVGTTHAYMINRPEYIGEVFQHDNVKYTRSVYHHRIKSLFGDGLVVSEGDTWRSQRKLMQPAFHKQRVAALAPIITDETAVMLASWQAPAMRHEPINITLDLLHLTQTLLVRMVFGSEIGNEDLEEARAAVSVVNRELYKHVVFDWWRYLPLPSNVRYQRAVRALRRIMLRVLADKRRREVAGDDLLSMMMRGQTDDGERMSDERLQDEMITLFIAGHDTTVTTLSWTLYLLAQHPWVLDALTQQVDAVLGDRVPTYGDLNRLAYVRQVVDESLRLYPPAYGLTRKAVADDVLGGFLITAGSVVFMSPYVMHRHPDYWEDPERFDPGRFAEELTARRARYSYFPFAGGPRTCIGIHLALMEISLVITMLVQAYRFALVPERPVIPEPLLVLRPKGELFLSVSSRTNA